jgi:hypothetical protein
MRGDHGSLSEIEMAGAARDVRHDQRKKRPIKPCPNAIEALDCE